MTPTPRRLGIFRDMKKSQRSDIMRTNEDGKEGKEYAMRDNLGTKLVGKINGRFIVKDYQRGYRWTDEVDQLLEDISNMPGDRYCLQPIVVKNIGTKDDPLYELIDGQQRLTTIYLLYKWMSASNTLPCAVPKFSISYQTRPNSAEFLENIQNIADDYEPHDIDEFFMADSYRRIREWFNRPIVNPTGFAKDIYQKLKSRVSVIWYELGGAESTEDESINLFTRLNIGKIGLTNSELARALFLQSDDTGLKEYQQIEIATAWDAMERELHDERFWSFLTNASGSDYPARIELVLDLFVKKPASEKDPYFTFRRLAEMLDPSMKEVGDCNVTREDIWDDVCVFYDLLKELYSKSDYYHRIGYLIAVNAATWDEILPKAGLPKDQFDGELIRMIAASIDTKKFLNCKTAKAYGELSYEMPKEKSLQQRILLLFNVETARRSMDALTRFPFSNYKHSAAPWSLEHIHARQADGLNREEQWLEWLGMHKTSMERNGLRLSATLQRELGTVVSKGHVEGERYRVLSEAILEKFNEPGGEGYLHSLFNLALLDTGANAALSNSTFDVKRDILINKERAGHFIPECTRRAFFKIYSGRSASVMSCLWGDDDRQNYAAAINEMLQIYFNETEDNKEGLEYV